MSLHRCVVRNAILCTTTVLAASVAACRSRSDAANGGADSYAAMVADAVPKIEASTGLKFKHPPKLETRSKEQVRAFLLATLKDSSTQRELKGSEAAYKLLGMLPDTLDLQSLMVNLLTEQVVGFYDPKTKVLYVVEGTKPELVNLTVTHELVHALQDQYINLDSIQSSGHDNDRKMTAQAVFEGEALFEQFAANGQSLDVPGGWDQIRQLVRENQSAMPIFAKAPYFVQETLLFPYLNGAQFVKAYKDVRGKTMPFGDMPQSTEQILHPESYLGPVRDNPLLVSFAPITGITPTYDDNLGEFETQLLLTNRLGNAPDVVAASRGWAGDHYIVFRAPQGDGIAWASVWDTPAHAVRFAGVLNKAMANLPGKTNVSHSNTVHQIAVDGHPVVLYLSVPGGFQVPPALTDAIRIRTRK